MWKCTDTVLQVRVHIWFLKNVMLEYSLFNSSRPSPRNVYGYLLTSVPKQRLLRLLDPATAMLRTQFILSLSGARLEWNVTKRHGPVHSIFARWNGTLPVIFFQHHIYIGGLLSQRAIICLYVFKLFPSSKTHEILWAYQTQCMYSYGLITPINFFVCKVICCLSRQWSREGKLWRPVTHKVLNRIKIWFHIHVDLFKIYLLSNLIFFLDKILKLAILVHCVPYKSVKACVYHVIEYINLNLLLYRT